MSACYPEMTCNVSIWTLNPVQPILRYLQQITRLMNVKSVVTKKLNLFLSLHCTHLGFSEAGNVVIPAENTYVSNLLHSSNAVACTLQ